MITAGQAVPEYQAGLSQIDEAHFFAGLSLPIRLTVVLSLLTRYHCLFTTSQ